MEEKKIFKKIKNIFLEKRGYLINIPKKNTPVILLFSGGFDSSLLWFILTKKYNLIVYPIFFYQNYLNHFFLRIKIKKVEKFIKKNCPKHFRKTKFVKITNLFSFSKIDRKKIITDYFNIIPNLISLNLDNKNKVKKNYISLIANPGRLWLFAFYAHQYAYQLRYQIKKDINTIFIGLVPDDSTTLRESTLTHIYTLNLNFCLFLGNFHWQLIAPLEKKSNFYYLKKDLLNFAKRYNFPAFKTWSCTKSVFIHCGKCFNCIKRQEAFRSLNTVDKTIYLSKISKKLSSFLKFKINKSVFFTKKMISLIKKAL
jgi:7-cyano-7-deazaguanine synthase in queuosine biosynthesis